MGLAWASFLVVEFAWTEGEQRAIFDLGHKPSCTVQHFGRAPVLVGAERHGVVHGDLFGLVLVGGGGLDQAPGGAKPSRRQADVLGGSGHDPREAPERWAT